MTSEQLANKRPTLADWILSHSPGDEMYWRGSFRSQAVFFRKSLPIAFGMTFEDAESPRVAVISEHRSKSIVLPVVQYTLNRVRVTIRDNFYDYKVSVDADKKLVLDPRGLFDPDATHSGCYCEGFPEELVFGSYHEDTRQFTVSLGSEYAMWSFGRTIRLAIDDAALLGQVPNA